MADQLKRKYWFDFAMSVVILFTAISGLINLAIHLMDANEWPTFLGLPPDLWVGIHAFFGVSIVILVLLHLLMHTDWIAFASKKIFSKQQPPPSTPQSPQV